ncbi:unnamed protein product (macronuclear) [Paramecium tetraurelia]|uniref:NADH dehydrogenase [ubiquinone] 1 beta subcomplex subunit 7 n=1 Tax=Paramecium tetraurelia TaxID=5888 RepID=A0D0K4_PARTE|nr:uncharacterized protein GSPATT00012123001 [Paramecium tetraurelia]CAK76571.1 unnamed protein product [Paramecium tetraurelia]|eukprot:XP_001443968.1 hypothetical protein (macronuclear) [Paramecium tetraurelia strain d4-2]
MSSDNPDGQPLDIEYYETNYPYLNVKKNLLNNTLSKWRRAIAPYNPFAMQQIPNQKRMGMGIRNGNGFYFPDPYPNRVNWSVFFPTHYDPLSEQHFGNHGWQTRKDAPMFTALAIRAQALPRGCVRQIDAFKRCQNVNGVTKCQEEADNIISICPKWALEGLKEKKRQLDKIEAIQTLQYRSVLEVSPYNKGRTAKDVSDKTWADGHRDNLRPDTMWADERYTNITQSEINEAKKRVAARDAASGRVKEQVYQVHHPDMSSSHISEDKPLYP